MTSNELLFVFIPRLILSPFFFLTVSSSRPPSTRLPEQSEGVQPNPPPPPSEVGLMEGVGSWEQSSAFRLTQSSGLRRSPRRSHRKNLDLIPSFRRLPLSPDTAEPSRGERRPGALLTAGQVGLLVAARCKRRGRQRDGIRAHGVRSAFRRVRECAFSMYTWICVKKKKKLNVVLTDLIALLNKKNVRF